VQGVGDDIFSDTTPTLNDNKECSVSLVRRGLYYSRGRQYTQAPIPYQ
jgi:hypothetical protein